VNARVEGDPAAERGFHGHTPGRKCRVGIAFDVEQPFYKAIGDVEQTRRAAQRTLARAEKITTQEPDNGLALGYVVCSLCILGDAERAKELAKRAMLLDSENLTMRYNFACGFAALGEHELVLDLLGPIFESDARETVNWAKVDPDFDAVRDHPRFKAMMEKADARLAAASN
jgi:adenylate cyclase